MNESGVKQQIIDSIKNADTVLVTVGKHSSVDELSAALGATLYLNEIGKHATAVVSGDIPPAITFLKPEKTFENSVDSLRDFVIALDKEKADHLRYKVEGDVVKIFITPYKTVISQKDLEYSQGDYNVELVLAFGVKDQDQLDNALSAHGRILHDAAVATVGLQPSTLGTMDWNNPDASSLSEMAAELIEALQSDTKPMTEQVASALLTGIVAATDRFSNESTTARVMTVAAKLMAKGANQQLIAAKLREGSKLELSEGKSSKPISSDEAQTKQNPPRKKGKKRDDSRLAITHDEELEATSEEDSTQKQAAVTQDAQPDVPPVEIIPSERTVETPAADEVYDPAAALDAALKKSETHRQEQMQRSEEELARELEETVAASTATSNLAAELAEETAVVEDSAPEPVYIPTPAETKSPEVDDSIISAVRREGGQTSDTPQEPNFGGTLSATTQQAAESKRQAEEESRNKTILSHAPGQHVGENKPVFDVPFNGATVATEPPSIDPFKDIQMTSTTTPDLAQNSTAPVEAFQPPTLTEIDQQHRQVVPTPTFEPMVLPAVTPMPESQPEPTFVPPVQAPDTPPPPPTPDFSQLPPLPQMPDFTQLPPVPAQEQILPPEQPLGEMLPPPPLQDQTPQTPPPPGQFKIPGQQ